MLTTIIYFDELLVFSCHFPQLTFLKKFLKKFLERRGLMVVSKTFYTKNENYSFDFLSWNFSLINNKNFVISFLSRSIIKNQKLMLKKIVKNALTSTPLKLVLSLNLCIENFVSSYKYLDSIYDLYYELDVYLYKSLWKWAKKRHPRRSHTWIYSKYWKFIFGKWNFISFNKTLGTLCLLRLHFSFQKERLFCLPALLNIFYFSTKNKLTSFWVKQLNMNLKGIYLLLWKKQKGICFLCRQPFMSTKSQEFKIVKSLVFSFNQQNPNFTFVLLHQYCFMLFYYLKIY
uniref:RoaA n=1 Tax=Euglenaformis proxima TaxID=299110 RepID=A0A023HHN8_9EUGL|nr:RoaA [Euglenaformis proxima]AGL12007.1 RoaA [Euglenaformis proxima]